MSAEVSFTKRAAAELSRCFNGITVRQNKNKSTAATAAAGQHNEAQTNGQTSGSGQSKDQKPLITETTHLISSRTVISGKQLSNSCFNTINGNINTNNISNNLTKVVNNSTLNTPNGTPRRGSRNGLPPPQAPPKTLGARRKNYLLSTKRARYLEELWTEDNFLMRFFKYFSPLDRCVLAQVCKRWQTALYSDHRYWDHLMPVILCNELRREKSFSSLMANETNGDADSPDGQESTASQSADEVCAKLLYSLDVRGFDSICLFGATDGDIVDIASKMTPKLISRLTSASLRNASVSDKALEVFLAALTNSLTKLELSGCNEISDSVLWAALVPRLEVLIVMDCINISDETIAAICQMLPNLKKLQIQAYHVTDTSMAYFGSTSAAENLRVLMLHHCWELSNQGVASLAHGLPNLHTLSLSGCSKVSDDAIEVIAEQLRALKYLDLSWCPRISDAALEYIACDLSDSLSHLILDRCLHITDIGMGYVATMPRLTHLSLRWCPQVRDFGLQTLCSIRSLHSLSLAGCPHVTISGLSCLVQMQTLVDLELTNCPAATKELVNYLRDNLPAQCTIIT